MPQIGIYHGLSVHNHSGVTQGGLLDHAVLTNVLSDQHHALPNLGDLTIDCACKAYLTADQTCNNGVMQKILWNAEDFDIGGDFRANGSSSLALVFRVFVALWSLLSGFYSELGRFYFQSQKIFFSELDFALFYFYLRSSNCYQQNLLY